MGGLNTKGDRRERELVNRLDAAGFAVMRAPASGSATGRDLPDVLAGNGGAFYAIEAKSSAGDPIYLDGAEVESLIYFSRNFGAAPKVGVRFDREDWYFFHPGELHTTDAGNYRVKKETALGGETIDDLAAAETGDGGSADRLREVLDALAAGGISVDDAVALLE